MIQDNTFIDLFAGIGGFHLGLNRLGMKAVFASELDKHARETYLSNHEIDPDVFNDDIRAINPEDIPDHTILCAGFPCQPFSQAGHKKGFEDGDKSERGNLFFCILDILEAKRPKAFILENVRHLLKHDDGNTFKRIQNELTAAGYSVNYKIIKASDFGRPQHRARIFIVGFDKAQVDTSHPFEFPEPIPLEMNMSDIWEGKCERDIGFTLRVGGRGSAITDRRNWDSYMVDGEVKRLGPIQGRRMMGYPENFILPQSITQSMKQLGNSVCVDVVEHVGRAVHDYLEKQKGISVNTRNFSLNCGEWGELYTFFKMLIETQIHFADKHEEALPDFITIYEAAHNESQVKYKILNSMLTIKDVQGNEISQAHVSNFITEAQVESFLEEIKSGSGRTFQIPSVEPILDRFLIESFKGRSDIKGDINLSFIHENMNLQNQSIGIKAKLCGAPSLLNASSATNFIYKIDGVTPELLNTVNSIGTRSKIKDRVAHIYDEGCQLTYIGCEREVHENNLRLVDSHMPEIISRMLLDYYRGIGSKVSELVTNFQETCRVREYLKDIMLGMFSNSVWDGRISSNGSILLEKDGGLKLYHMNKADILKDYLFENTKLDTPSSTRHRFGTIYFEPKRGEYLMKLNLQIRMI